MSRCSRIVHKCVWRQHHCSNHSFPALVFRKWTSSVFGQRINYMSRPGGSLVLRRRMMPLLQRLIRSLIVSMRNEADYFEIVCLEIRIMWLEQGWEIDSRQSSWSSISVSKTCPLERFRTIVKDSFPAVVPIAADEFSFQDETPRSVEGRRDCSFFKTEKFVQVF